NADAPVQKQEASKNETGMPDDLKSGVESLSGMDMSDVNVHYNSSKPGQLKAHAYAQGSDIHIAPGQEQHLAHEAWHVAQQKQGRVQATTERGGAPVNDDAGLEKEADDMGAKAMQMKSEEPSQLKQVSLSSNNPVQGYFIDGSWIIADDGKLAVKKKAGLQGGGHEAYAEAGKAAESNAIRKDSPIELYETGWFRKKFKDERGGTHKLKRIKAKNTGNKTKGNNMKLDHDCGESSAKVQGVTYDRKGVHSGGKETSSSYSPFTYKHEMFKDIFTSKVTTWKANLKANEDFKAIVDKRLSDNGKVKVELAKQVIEKRKAIDAAKTSKESSEEYVAENSKEYTGIKGKSDFIDQQIKANEEDIRYYEGLQERQEYTEDLPEEAVKEKLAENRKLLAEGNKKKKAFLDHSSEKKGKTNAEKMTHFEEEEKNIADQSDAIPELQKE
ncbi:MAG: DUF4157 domain-containing protein, partial [Bacteroidota bacterium]